MSTMGRSKIYKILILTIITFLLTTMLTSYSMAVQNIGSEYSDEKEFTNGFVGGLKGTTDVVQNHSEHYTVDSSGYEAEPEMSAGATIDSQIKFDEVPKINGKEVTNFEIVVATSEHYTVDEAAEAVANMFKNAPKEKYAEIMREYYKDGFTYGGLLGTGKEYTIEVVIGSDGKAIYKVPDDFPEGIFAFKSLIINGTEIEIDRFDRVYVRNGDGDSNTDPDKDPNKDTDDGPDTDIEDDYRWVKLETSTKEYTHSTPSISGGISSEQYDVSESIPTSENLNFYAQADDSLYNIVERNYVGSAGVKNIELEVYAKYYVNCTCTRDVPVKDKNGNNVLDDKGNVVTKKERGYHGNRYHTVTVSSNEKGYSYSSEKTSWYDVPTSTIFPVSNATISGAPVSGSVSMNLKGGEIVNGQTIKVKAQLPNIDKKQTKNCGIFNSRTEAQKALNRGMESLKASVITAVNDAISYTGNCNYSYRGLNVTSTSSNGVMPEIVKTSGSAVRMIPSTQHNGNYETSGAVTYVGFIPFSMKVNNVFVHTPVVNNANITYVEPFINQKINKSDVEYLQLDKSFTVTIPNDGTHKNAKGYGTRLYNSWQAVPKTITNWGKIKDVKISFDVYLHEGNSRTLIKAGKWLSEYGKATSNNTYTFTIPVWAQEGIGTIETRVIAENGSTDFGAQAGANLDYNNYIATKTINVEVVGKIYDLRISATNDPGWQTIKGKNGNYVTASEFAFGQLGQNGVNGYKYAPRLGYTIVFDFKTKGIKSNSVNVSVQPEGFYFVSKSGGKAEAVDLYYNTTTKKYIKIETRDTTNIPIITNLTNSFMKVSRQELIDSTRIMNNKLGAGYNYSNNVNIGYFPRLKMPENLRLCYNNFTEYVGNGLYKKTENAIIEDATNGFSYNTRWSKLQGVANGKDVVIGAVGHWYAGYKLPASTIAVPAGKTSSDIMSDSSIVKKDGYVLVKFNIRTNYDTWEYLEYKGPESQNEGGKIESDSNGTPLNWPAKGSTALTPSQTITLPNGKTAEVPIGVVGIFETDFRSSNDYETEGTH